MQQLTINLRQLKLKNVQKLMEQTIQALKSCQNGLGMCNFCTIREITFVVAWRTLLVFAAKNLTSFGSYELIKTQIALIFGKKLKFINSFPLNIFFLAVKPK